MWTLYNPKKENPNHYKTYVSNYVKAIEPGDVVLLGDVASNRMFAVVVTSRKWNYLEGRICYLSGPMARICFHTDHICHLFSVQLGTLTNSELINLAVHFLYGGNTAIPLEKIRDEIIHREQDAILRAALNHKEPELDPEGSQFLEYLEQIIRNKKEGE